MPEIDFKGLAAAALGRAEQLLEAWLPEGKRAGHEYQACNPTRGDASAGSFSININTGCWGDFATDDAGGDLVSLYAYLFCRGDQLEAAKALAELLGMPDAVPPAQPGRGRGAKAKAAPPVKPAAQPIKKASKARSDWVPVLPVPADAPEPPKAHEFRGLPSVTWTYRAADGAVLGYVCRFEKSDGGKEIVPLTWCRHAETARTAWRWLSFADPRPLYGLDRLAARPDATVLVVEGEKCADAASAELPDLVVVTWPGGGKAAGKVDWLPLAGRKVITWADSDAQRAKLTKADKEAGADPLAQPILPLEEQPGHKTMAKVRGILHKLGCQLWDVQLAPPGERPGGWDVADAIADGLTGTDLEAWVRERSQRWAPEVAGGGDGGRPPPPSGPPPEDGGEAPHWRERLVWNKRKDTYDDCVANVHDILEHRQEWQGVLGFDEFTLRIVKRRPPPYRLGAAGEWTDDDTIRTAMWLTHHEARMTPSTSKIEQAVKALSKEHSFHPVCAWLSDRPAWDGIERLDTWLVDFLGVEDSPYVRLVSRFYLVGMVARVAQPGCQMDYCLVLEGPQGRGKSSALRVLAGNDWYADTDLDLHSKDAMSSLQGVWLYEFAELGSVARAEATRQKSFLSRQVDKFRPVYGHCDVKVPRQLVFAGTTNEWEWNKDPTGGRRFWPVMVGEIDLVGLAAMRDQLFAEAVLAFRAEDARWWPTPDEQRDLFDPEQLAREQPESLVDALHDWVYAQASEFSIAQAAMDGLKCDASKLTRDFSTRIGIALRKLGCTRVERRNGMVRYWYKPPAKTAAWSAPDNDEERDDRVPF